MDETYIKLFYIEREQLKNRDTFISPKEKLENIFQSKIEINNLKFSDQVYYCDTEDSAWKKQL